MMDNADGLILPVLSVTLLLFFLCGFVVMLLVMSNTRRIRHRAELAELKQQQDRAVMEAEREAVRHTLRDIGRDLHDNAGQLLAVAQIGINTAMNEGAVGSTLVAARDALEQGMEAVRRLGHDLNTELWRKRSLSDAISAEAERVERVSRVQVRLRTEGAPLVLDPDTNTMLFRVFQVILANAIKHSGADRIDITITGSPIASLEVTDNGRGFDLERVMARAGLVNISERCALIGWQTTCTTAPGKGCSWRLQPTK